MRRTTTLKKMALEGEHWKDWYERAATQITQLCAEKGWDCDEFIDVLAVTSPRVPVKRNLRYALHWFRTHTYPADLWESFRRSLEHYYETGEIRGPKTSAFAAALKGEPDAIVLDVWMAKAFGVEQGWFRRQANRDRAASAILRIAEDLQWEPRQAQAAIWCTTVKQHRRTVPHFNIAEELTLFE